MVHRKSEDFDHVSIISNAVLAKSVVSIADVWSYQRPRIVVGIIIAIDHLTEEEQTLYLQDLPVEALTLLTDPTTVERQPSE